MAVNSNATGAPVGRTSPPVGSAGPAVGRTGPAVGIQLSWRVSRHTRRLFYLALAGLALAVVTKRPELVGVAAPALVLLCAWRAPRPETAELGLRLSARRVYEGEHVDVYVEVTGQGDHAVDVVFHPSGGFQAVDGAGRAEAGTIVLSFCATHWGRRWPGAVEVVLWDRYRMFESHNFVVLPELACYPKPAGHRKAAVLGRLASRSGDHQARSPGDGSEFLGVRQYVAGDRQRSINWAATTRRGRLQVNTFAAERSQDVVLIVDATSELGNFGSTPVDLALRGSLGVARTYLDARDRVGAVFYGGHNPGLARHWQDQQLRWVAPGTGERQFLRLMGAALEVQPGYSWGGDAARVPRAALPPGASVVAFSPLIEPKFVETLRDLRQRGFSVVVIDVLNVGPSAGRTSLARLAARMWRMERDALMFSLGELGIRVVHWDGNAVLTLPAQRNTRQRAGSPQ